MVGSWPTLAKPTLANFSVLVFWPNFVDGGYCCCVVAVVLLLLCCCFVFVVVVVVFVVVVVVVVWFCLVVVVGLDSAGPPSAGPSSAGPSSAGPPSAGPPKISLFFFPFPPPFRSFGISLGVFSLNFGGFCEDRDPHMCTFGLSGCRVKPRRLRGRRGFTQQPDSKRAHLRPRRFQTPREDPQRDAERAKRWREREKKARNFGLPTLRGPTLQGPTLSGPHPFGAPLFLGLGPPPFRGPPFGALHF